MIRAHREEQLAILLDNIGCYENGSMSDLMARQEFFRFAKYHIQELAKETFGSEGLHFNQEILNQFKANLNEFFEKQKVQRREPLDFFSVTGKPE